MRITPEEIDEMPAGPKLDALVGRRIMGMVGSGDNWSPHDKQTGITLDSSFPLPSYSTDIAAALRVVSANLDYYIRLSGHGDDWECVFFTSPEQSAQSLGSSPAEAICKAAYKAVVAMLPIDNTS